MIAVVPCLCRYTYVCAACPERLEVELAYLLNGHLVPPSLPNNWRCIEGRLFCPRHRVDVYVTDRTAAVEPESAA